MSNNELYERNVGLKAALCKEGWVGWVVISLMLVSAKKLQLHQFKTGTESSSKYGACQLGHHWGQYCGTEPHSR